MAATLVTTTLVGLAMALAPAAARAAELRVLAGGSLTESLKELAPRYERASGQRVVLVFGSTPQLIREATSGAPFDLGVVPVDVLKDSAARARFVPDAPIDIARVGFGVAVRAGAAKPDLGTPESFKRSLIAARSLALLPESAAGAYVQTVFERLGIADAIRAKAKVQATPAGIPEAVAAGEAELGVFLTNVLAAPGVELAGPFPPALQQDLVFAGAVAAGTGQAGAAAAFLAYLRTPDAVALLRSKGLTPG